MPQCVAFFGKPSVLRLLTAGLLASSVAACSDSSRFGDNPFSNPFTSSASAPPVDRTATHSVPSRAAPIGAVSSQPLPPALPRSAGIARSVPASVPPSPVTGSAEGWTAQGGTPVTVGAGETAQTLSSRYGVPASAILAANGGRVVPGQQAIIPILNPNASQRSTAMSAPVSVPQATPLARPVANPVTTPAPRGPGVAQTARPIVQAQPKQSNSDDDDDEETTPKGRIIPAAPRASQAAPAQRLAQAETQTRAAAQPVRSTAPASRPEPSRPQPRIIPMSQQQPDSAPLPAPKAQEVAKADPATTQSIAPAASAPSSEKADFRWPARGRIISGFGSKTGNGDGIAIAVPEGTPVKAAEGGTVAYAGEELKGYGKLVLIRHDNGYVTAYAHNSNVDVKRGDRVSRGQTIARSGSTGNVTSPQLHFEVRKGSTPVDPTKFLD